MSSGNFHRVNATSFSRRMAPVLMSALLVLGCVPTADVPADDSASADSTTAVITPIPDSSVDTSAAGGLGAAALPHHAGSDAPLPPQADSIAQRLVFYPVTQNWFVGAKRGKRLLVDLGRVDMEVRKDSARSLAYREAVAARSPVPIGTRLRLRGAWGEDDATVSGFDTWNGRIAATVTTAPRVDSLVAVGDSMVVIAQRVETTVPPVTDACVRDSSAALLARMGAIRDSVLAVLKAKEIPPYARLQKSIRTKSWQTVGCFDGGQGVVIVAIWAGEYEWTRERAYLVDVSGATSLLTMRDFRFKVHELLGTLDADGDGFHDVVARGFAERAGATVVLRVAERKRLERIAAGFAWENR